MWDLAKALKQLLYKDLKECTLKETEESMVTVSYQRKKNVKARHSGSHL
jgi:hypothetical protein